MEKSIYFPAVKVQPEGNQFRALTGLRVLSILSPRLRYKHDYETDLVTMQHCKLLHALAAWPDHMQLVLNLISRPAPENPSEGKIDLNILLKAKADLARSAVAEVLARFGVLFSLLNNFLPSVEFEPIFADEHLDSCLLPLAPVDIVRFMRKSQKLVVTDKDVDLSSVPRTPLGFLAVIDNHSATRNGQNTIDHLFPWHPGLVTDLSQITEAMLWFPAPLWLQVRLTPCKPAEKLLQTYLQKIMFCEKLLAGETYGNGLLSLQVSALRQHLTLRYQNLKGNAFRCGVYLCSDTPLDEALIAAVARVINRESLSDGLDDKFVGGIAHQRIESKQFLDPNYFHDEEPLLPEEAACALRIPHPQNPSCTGLPIKHFRTALADPMLIAAKGNKTISIGCSRHRGHNREIFLAAEDRLRHICVLGQSGAGKSSLLEEMAISDIKAGRGICLIDPHQDLVRNVLNRYPEHRINDLVLLDFNDPQWVIPFNLLACRTPEDRDLIIDDLYCWVDNTYHLEKTGGPMFEQLFRSFLRMLLVERPKADFVPTLTDFSRLFLDEEFRNFCKRTLDDTQVLSMVRQVEKTTGETGFFNMIPYVTSKFNRFELDTGLRRMVGQEKMAIDFQSVMDEGKVMLVSMGGAFGASIRSLLASQIVNRFHMALEGRKTQSADQRRDFYLYIDEFQNIVSEKIINMFSEARKYRLGLVVANQFMDQLENQGDFNKGPSALSAILGNVGTTICFRLGIKDAERMEASFLPTFTKEDLISLPVGACYVNLRAGNHPPATFSLHTSYSPVPFDKEKVDRLRQASLAKYAYTKDDADKNISMRERFLKRTVELFR